ADFDFLLRDRDDKCRNYEAKPHESVADLGMKFFAQQCTCGADGKNHLEKLRSFRAGVKRDDPEGFYQAKCLSGLKDAERAGRWLKYLRSKGVGILSGEIESLSKDTQFISAESKLS